MNTLKTVSFDTKPFKNPVESGVIRKQNNLNTHRFIGNREDRSIRKTEAFNLSFKKRSSKGFENGQIRSNGNTHVIVLTKTEWPGVDVQENTKRTGERTEAYRSGSRL